MNIVSFFSGAGGLDLGFIMAGHHIVWANDNDKFAVETYNRNIGRYENHNALLQNIVEYLDCDAQEIDARIPNCDLIIGGFPCQGFTIANLKRSMDDDRNFLYHQLLKAISVKQPDYFLLENVKGLENIDKGRVLPMILDDLQNCGTINSKFFPQNGNGYTVVYNIVNAINFGVPQNRERVIILGINNDIFEDSPMRAYILDRPVSKNKDRRKRLNIQPTYSVYSETVNPVLPRQIVDELYDDFINHRIVRPHNQEANPIYRATTLRDAIGDLPLEYSNDIPNHQGTKCKVKIKNVIGNRATDWDRKAPTIMGRGSGTGGPLIPPHPNQHRRLTVRETARIQTFPDNFIFCGSNSACYRQIGNAVPVLLAYNIGLLFPNE